MISHLIWTDERGYKKMLISKTHEPNHYGYHKSKWPKIRENELLREQIIQNPINKTNTSLVWSCVCSLRLWRTITKTISGLSHPWGVRIENITMITTWLECNTQSEKHTFTEPQVRQGYLWVRPIASNNRWNNMINLLSCL